MNFRFAGLTLQAQKERIFIEFSHQISFFHGQISAGKSSIARLVDFCLGGKLQRTPALSQELVAVELAARIGEYDVLFEREAHGSNQVQVTWKKESGEAASVLAPITAVSNTSPIWGEEVFNLSDLIFNLMGIKPIKVRRSKTNIESPLERLSFRDIMWYCYLEQDHLDSSFFRLEDPMRGRKSRDVMRFIVGFYTERLNELEIYLEQVREERFGKIEAAKQIRKFLQQFGYGSEAEIMREIEATQSKLADAKSELSELRQGHMVNTHFADELRARLRDLSSRLGHEEQAIKDLEERIDAQESLKAEMLSAKFKLSRKESASAILSGVVFEFCPACGTRVDSSSNHNSDVCALCGKHPSPTQKESAPQAEIVRRDLTSRLVELEESIKRHKDAYENQKRAVAEIRREKAYLDAQLNEELKNYDSMFLARSRELERRVATLEERVNSLERVVKMPEAIAKLEREADELIGKEEEVRRYIEEEKASLTGADKFVQEIEEAFLEALLLVGVPGVQPNDQVRINRKTWIPSILSEGEEALQWNFYNAGSGGKKTLLNVCYALAVHKIAAMYDLPLPNFIIVDTPMKNIGEDVNRNLFVAFYNYLYILAAGSLSNTQFLIIDKEYIAPDSQRLEIIERYMTPNEEEHPPLISYYRGA